MGEAGHAPPTRQGRAGPGRQGPHRPKGGAAIFGTQPGARLNTIKVRKLYNQVTAWLKYHLSDKFHPGRAGRKKNLIWSCTGARRKEFTAAASNYALLWGQKGGLGGILY